MRITALVAILFVANYSPHALAQCDPPSTINMGLSFDGSNDIATAPFSCFYPTDQYTISARVNVSASTQLPSVILCYGESIPPVGDPRAKLPWSVVVYTNTGDFVDGELGILWETDSDADIRKDSDFVINDGLWHDIAITFSGSTLTFYVDGVMTKTHSIPANQMPTTSFGENAIGMGAYLLHNGTVAGHLEGMLDEVTIWDIEYPDSIDDLFDGSFSVSDPNLIAYWDFQGSGQVLADRSISPSPSDNRGTLGMFTVPEGADPLRVPVP